MSERSARRELAVLIVSYRRADLLERALASVDKWIPDAPVHVWDNASSGSPQVRELAATRPDVTWTFSETNLGYIAAMNRLMAQTPDHDALQLNPDAELLGPLTRAREVLGEPGVAAVSPTVLDPDGRDEPWDVAHREQGVVRNLVNAAGYAKRLRGRLLSNLYEGPQDDVDGYLTGCCLFISRDAWNALGPFDEAFFVYGEDATWQPDARRAGWSLRLVDDDEPQVRHASGGTVSDDPLASTRGDDLLRAAQVIALGLRHQVGRGSLFSAGATVLERVQRSKRAPRRARLEALARQAAGRPAVVVLTQGLRTESERRRVVLANQLVARGHPVTMVCLAHLGPYVAELDPRVRVIVQPWWQPVVDVADTEEAIVVGGTASPEIGFATTWRALGHAVGQRRSWLAVAHEPADPQGPTYPELTARALRTADGLLVPSRAHGDELARHQRLPDDVLVAPDGLAPGEPLPARPALSSPSHPVRFGVRTRLEEAGNTTLLVRALDALARPDEWTLDVFGDGPDRVALQAQTPAYLRGQVRWHTEAASADVFADLDVLCVPGVTEAFPLVVVEAMTRGLPVVASASGSVPEMLDGGAAGVVVAPVTVPAWTEALRGVLDDRGALARLGAAGRERALARYTETAMADAYQRAIVHVLGHPFPGVPEA